MIVQTDIFFIFSTLHNESGEDSEWMDDAGQTSCVHDIVQSVITDAVEMTRMENVTCRWSFKLTMA